MFIGLHFVDVVELDFTMRGRRRTLIDGDQ
jgi:hypothetical protein